jgi:hypothetical protein
MVVERKLEALSAGSWDIPYGKAVIATLRNPHSSI